MKVELSSSSNLSGSEPLLGLEVLWSSEKGYVVSPQKQAYGSYTQNFTLIPKKSGMVHEIPEIHSWMQEQVMDPSPKNNRSSEEKLNEFKRKLKMV